MKTFTERRAAVLASARGDMKILRRRQIDLARAHNWIQPSKDNKGMGDAPATPTESSGSSGTWAELRRRRSVTFDRTQLPVLLCFLVYAGVVLYWVLKSGGGVGANSGTKDTGSGSGHGGWIGTGWIDSDTMSRCYSELGPEI